MASPHPPMNPPPLPIYALPHPPTGDADARAAARVADGGPAFWQAFYLRHGARFFKDRHWLGREFEELGAATTLLEVGCGVGNAARPLAALCPGATVYACDYAAEAVRLLAASPEAREGRVVPFVADAAAPGALTGPGRSPTGGVAVATLVFVLSAVEPGEPMRQVVRNVATALRRDGKGQALVRDYCAGDLAQARLAAARGGRGLGVSRLFMRGDGTRAYYFYPEELVALFEGEGFRCESVRVVDADRVNRAQGAVMRRKWVQATFTLVADSGQCAGEDAGEAGACGGPSAGQGGTATVAGAALLTRLLLPAAATADGPTHLTPPGTGAAPAPPSLNKLAPLYRAEWEDSDDGSGDEGSSDGSAGAARAAARLYRDIQGGDGSGEDGAVLEQQYVDVGPPLGRLALVAVPGSLRHTTRHTGLLLWGAAPSLGRTLLKCPQLLSRGPVIELGAGASPAVMLAALRAGAPRVVATDGSVRALRVLERNVRVNAR